MTNPCIDKLIKNPKNKSKKKGCIETVDLIGCLIFLIMWGFIFTLFYPSYLVYQDQGKREFALPFIKTIQSSLRIYSEQQPNNLFPSEINDYEVLCQIVNKAGKSIPKIQADTKIEYFRYEATDRKSYILNIHIEDNKLFFFTLYPDGILEVRNLDQIGDSAMELVGTILNMDRALQENDMTEYFKYYSPDATIHIRHKAYKGHRPVISERESIVHEDLELYFDSLLEFYSNTFIEYRKRKDISISKKEQYWEVHSSYIEEGTIKGKKYRKDGQNIYSVDLSERPNYIVNDKSYASIYLLEN